MHLTSQVQFLSPSSMHAAGVLTSRKHLDLLSLKWISDGEALEDFKGYLCRSKTGEKIATGASKT